jgi:hypothetical protein
MFGRLFGKKAVETPPGDMVIVQLNARLQPMHRGEFFEDPLDEVLKKHRVGAVTGGGTKMAESGEIEYCDIELQLPQASPDALQLVISTLEGLGAPKGSKLRVAGSDTELVFGKAEGLAVYLNGTDLPEETYASCDSNFVYSEFDRLLAPDGRVMSYWEGSAETAFYVYGGAFPRMSERLAEFIASYPLCRDCRVVQVA